MTIKEMVLKVLKSLIKFIKISKLKILSCISIYDPHCVAIELV